MNEPPKYSRLEIVWDIFKGLLLLFAFIGFYLLWSAFINGTPYAWMGLFHN